VTNPPKARGTATESSLARWLTAAGLPTERRVLTGSADQGDLWTAHGKIIWEVKTRRTAHTPRDVEKWLQELDRETVHACKAGAACDMALLVVKRVGSGLANIGDWHAFMRPGDAAYLLTGVSISDGHGWVQMPLWLVAERLRDLFTPTPPVFNVPTVTSKETRY
jgi:hypothetical protein